MAANPVQIVLNNYVRHVPPEPGGSEKDFFEGKDHEFLAHRQSLSAKVALR